VRAESVNENQFNFNEHYNVYTDSDYKSKNNESNELDKFAGSLYESSVRFTNPNDISNTKDF
jgi:hypothetical protein